MLTIRLFGDDETCPGPREVLHELERMTATTLTGFGPEAWVFKIPRTDGGQDPLLTVHGFVTSREFESLQQPRPHVSEPLLPRTVPDDVDEVQRFNRGIKIEAFPDLDAGATADLVRIVTTLVDTLGLQVADDWMHLLRREWLESYLEGEVARLINGTPRSELTRAASIWRFRDELFGIPRHLSGVFTLDGTELRRAAVATDDLIGLFASSVTDLSRPDDPAPDTTKRFPDGEKLVIKAAKCRSKTEFMDGARRVGVWVLDNTWFIQPLRNQGPRKPWYAEVRADPPYGLRDPSPAEIGKTLMDALHHFDHAQAAPQNAGPQK